MKKRLLPLLCGISLLAGCAAQEPEFSVEIKNLTGVPISELQMTNDTDENPHKVTLSETIADGETVTIMLGKLTEDEIAEGFSLHVVADDGSYEDLGGFRLSSGDLITVYLDELGVAAAVNTDDAEIEEMIEALKTNTIPAS